MKENKKLFVKVPNNMVRENKNIDSVSKDQGVLPVAVYCYIASEENYKGVCKITLREILEFFKYKPDNHKGKINEKLRDSYNWLVSNDYINHISGDAKKIDNLIKCTINKPEKLFTMIDYENLGKINNPDELILYASLLSRMKHSKECEITGSFCYPTIQIISEDIGLSDKTIKKLLNDLQEKELIIYGNIGYIQKGDCGKILANNVYALDQDSFKVALSQSRYYYEQLGYEAEKKPSNYKRRDKDIINIEKKAIKEYIDFITSKDTDICISLEIMQQRPIEDILKINVIRELNPVLWDIEKIFHKNEEMINRSYFDFKMNLRKEITDIFKSQNRNTIEIAKNIVSEWNKKYNTNLKTECDYLKIVELKYNLEKIQGS